MEERHMKRKPIADRQGGTDKQQDFYRLVAEVLQAARAKAYRAVNFTMVEAYWHVGRMIVEEEQQGRERAEYGAALIRNLSIRLTKDFGKGFTEGNLWNFRQFFLVFPTQGTENGKLDALRRELTWTHYRHLMRVESPAARAWYMQEAADQNWSTRTLQRQINALYYERLLMSRDKTPVIEEMQAQTLPLAATPKDFIKDPYILEFLGIPDAHAFRESDLEQAIIGKLQAFMLELGKGFAFVGRQYRLRTETKDFYVDLVFYNYILKCFVLIDLKTGELNHQDIGQMDMYVRLFEDTVRGDDDNPTVGLILCTEKDHTVAKYSVLNDSRQLFASKYRLYLPSEEELREEIERERTLAVQEQVAVYRNAYERAAGDDDLRMPQ
jgi:predicted nuclease of restriction endonuclease-like (RecB) superfamily